MEPSAPNAQLTAFAATLAVQPGLIADRAIPIVPVPRSVFEFYKADKALALRDVATEISPNGAPNELDDKGEWVAGRVLNESVMIPVPRQRIQDFAGTGYDPLQGATIRCRNAMDRRREIRMATLFGTEANFPADSVIEPDTAWDNADGLPLLDLESARMLCLFGGNAVAMGPIAWKNFSTNLSVIRAINPQGGSPPSPDAALAYLRPFGISELHVGSAVYNSAKRGQAYVQAHIWGDFAAVYYKAPAGVASVDSTQFAASFAVELGGAGVPLNVENWTERDRGTRGAEMVKVSREIVESIVEKACGALITPTST